jgi:hypothetical protein
MANGFDLTQNINLGDPELLDIFRGILDRRAAGSLKPIGAANKIKERIGERQALDRLSRRFPGAKPIVIAGRRNGVPILDCVLRRPDGGFVIIEAKFSSAGRPNLGTTNSRMWVETQRGWRQIKVFDATTQMSPRWIEDRLAELARSSERATRRLAGELNRALRAGRFNSYTVVTDSTGEVLKVIDNTPEWARSFTQRGVEFRTASPALEATAGRTAATAGEGAATAGAAEAAPASLSEVGERAVSSRLSGSAVAGEAEVLAARGAGASLAAREGGALAVRGGGAVAVRLAAVRGAAVAVGRALVTGLLRILPILNALGLLLLAVDVIGLIWDHYKDKAVQKAIEKALQTNIPTEITTALEKDKDEIARHYARAWINRRGRSNIFLYLSPRIVVEGGYREGGFHFTASVPVQSYEKDLVSTTFIEPRQRDVASSGPDYYEIELRWSVDQPIYTPFDIYLAFTEFFVEHIVDSWAMHYGRNVKLSPRTVSQFHRSVDVLASVSATLKFEPWFGFVADDSTFSSSRAAVDRWEALQKLSQRLEKELMPLVSALESKQLINSHTARLETFWSPLRSELDPREDDSLLPALEMIALDMKYLDSKYLEYERFQTLQARTRRHGALFAVFGASIEAQKQEDLKEFLRPVERFLPRSLAPPSSGFVLELDPKTAGELVLEPLDR